MEDSAADAAIKALNDTELDGRTLRVNEARPCEDRSNGGNRNRGFCAQPQKGSIHDLSRI